MQARIELRPGPPVYRPKSATAQAKPAISAQARTESRPAPPVYRPQSSAAQPGFRPVLSAAPRVGNVPQPLHGPAMQAKTMPAPWPQQKASSVIPVRYAPLTIQRVGVFRQPPVFVMNQAAIQCVFSKKDFPRPNFKSSVYEYATISHNLFQEDDLDKDSPGLSAINAAVPHRMSWADIRDNTIQYLNGKEGKSDFLRWTERFVTAGKEDKKILEQIAEDTKSFIVMEQCEELINAINKGTKAFVEARSELIDAVEGGNKDSYVQPFARAFLYIFNSYYPNVPDLRQHRGINIQVSNRPHSNIDEEGNKSPMTQQLWNMTPERLSEFPLDVTGENLITTSGSISLTILDDDEDVEMLENVGTKNINAKIKEYDQKKGWN
jgi:hypothetical protein